MSSRASLPWNHGDDKQLIQLVRRGLTAEQIARRLNRSTSSVRNRAKRLRLMLAKSATTGPRQSTPASEWKPVIGERVRLSELGRRRSPRMEDLLGTVVAGSQSPSTVGVRFDGKKTAVLMHVSYLQRLAE